MFKENGLKPHLYLWIAGIVFMILFFGYIFWFDHKENIDGSDLWETEFEKAGLTKEQREDISHDDSMWYYQRMATCVGYGSPNDECPRYESYCAGGRYAGSFSEQAKAVTDAIRKGGIHEDCPLIYSGTD
jgi:hypothetical protein